MYTYNIFTFTLLNNCIKVNDVIVAEAVPGGDNDVIVEGLVTS